MINTRSYILKQEIEIHKECPDYDSNKQICLAATGFMAPGRGQQMRYCATCDYDDCPVYLGKALRSSRSQGFERDSLTLSGK